MLNSRYFSFVKEFVNTNYSMVDKKFHFQLVYVRLVTLHYMNTKKKYLKDQGQPCEINYATRPLFHRGLNRFNGKKVFVSVNFSAP